MGGLWLTLLPLILASAVVPIQMAIVLLLLRRTVGGAAVAASWIAGMMVVRLAQGVVFGLLFPGDTTDPGDAGSDGAGPVVSGILLALAALLYATAVKSILTHQDDDAPPPKWLSMTQTMSAPKAFVIGAGLLLAGPKFWVFTLGAVSAVRDAGIGEAAGIASFLAYIVLCSAVLWLFVAMRVLAPAKSGRLLESSAGWLERHNRNIVIALGLVFGTWFLLKGLSGLGVI